jgi:hypothetical protein
MKVRILVATLVGAGVVAGSALACGGGWMGVNLVATPKVKAALRSAYLDAHPNARVGGPLSGHTYYGDYSGSRYAVATFGRFPTIFRTDRRGRWHVRRETHGGICTDVVPIELIGAWWLERWSDRCYVEPAR